MFKSLVWGLRVVDVAIETEQGRRPHNMVVKRQQMPAGSDRYILPRDESVDRS